MAYLRALLATLAALCLACCLLPVSCRHHKGHKLETLLTAGVLAKVLQKKGGGGEHHHPIYIPIPIPVHHHEKEHHHHHGHHGHHGSHHHHGTHHVPRFHHPPLARHPGPPYAPFAHPVPYGPAFQGSHRVETYSI